MITRDGVCFKWKRNASADFSFKPDATALIVINITEVNIILNPNIKSANKFLYGNDYGILTIAYRPFIYNMRSAILSIYIICIVPFKINIR